MLIEFDHIDKRPTKPATPGDRRASEALPIFEGSEVHFAVQGVEASSVAERTSYALMKCVTDGESIRYLAGVRGQRCSPLLYPHVTS